MFRRYKMEYMSKESQRLKNLEARYTKKVCEAEKREEELYGVLERARSKKIKVQKKG